MKKIIVILGLALLLASCVPTTHRNLRPSPEVYYSASQEDVFSAVLRILSTHPGVPAVGSIRSSGDWIITTSDRAGGFISAEAVSRALLGNKVTYEVHQINVIMSATGAGTSPQRTQVVIQGTPGAQDLAFTIYSILNAEFSPVR